MRIFKKIWIIFVLIPFFFFWFSTNKFEGWTHLELGAGNYGQDGHTQTALQKTILMKFSYVSKAKNFIEDLETKGNGDYKAEQQYGVLFSTLDELVKRRGPIGVFHVNDLYAAYVDFAVQKLKIYAQQKGYDSVIITGIPGDYEKIDAKKNLSRYRRKKYDSVHLKNPEITFFHDKMDGDNLYTSDQVRRSTRTLLQNLANLFENGLFFFTLYGDDFFPLIEQKEYVEKGVFYHLTQEWEPFPYIFPEGDTISVKWSKVFLIKPEVKK